MRRRLAVDRLREAKVVATTGHPMVVAHDRKKVAGRARSTCCSTATTTCSRPIRWSCGNADPFEPRIATEKGNGKVIVARGAEDNKGQLMTFFEAARAWKKVAGELPVAVTVLLEGEEECGSPSLPGFLAKHGKEVTADLALVCDTAQWDKDTPAITTQLRGLAGVELVITGPSRDLHSGIYGGAGGEPDPRAGEHHRRRCTTTRAACRSPGFYDGIEKPSKKQLKQWESLGFDEKEFLGDVGLSRAGGREEVQRAGADLGAADAGVQRHHRRLSGRRHEDGDPVEGVGEDHLPAGAGHEARTRCSRASRRS